MSKEKRIGKLRRRLQLESPVEAADEIGGFSRTWTNVASVWGEIETLSGEDTFEASQGQIQLTHRVTVRWRPDITGAMRLRDGARAFEIIAALDGDAQRRFLVCRCREIKP